MFYLTAFREQVVVSVLTPLVEDASRRRHFALATPSTTGHFGVDTGYDFCSEKPMRSKTAPSPKATDGSLAQSNNDATDQ